MQHFRRITVSRQSARRVTFIITKGKRMMALVWEMLCVQVSWPFM
jgi:hypothetical protein